jgi:hypothetical protein
MTISGQGIVPALIKDRMTTVAKAALPVAGSRANTRNRLAPTMKAASSMTEGIPRKTA